MGVRHRPGGGIIVPSLQEHVARRMHEESQVQKQKRKLREHKDSAKGPGKGKGGANNYPANPPKAGEGGGQKVIVLPGSLIAGFGLPACFEPVRPAVGSATLGFQSLQS